jgi:hypothetical protein
MTSSERLPDRALELPNVAADLKYRRFLRRTPAHYPSKRGADACLLGSFISSALPPRR